jgi:cysteinyl-tRNA synthetase
LNSFSITLEITQKYTNYFLEDVKKLNIQDKDIMPKATQYIPKMTTEKSQDEGLIE